MNMEKTLYISDLDGTLLNSKEEISLSSINTINELIEMGLIFTLASARSAISICRLAKSYGLRINQPIIAYNGVQIVSPISNKVLHSSTLEKAKLEDVLPCLIDAGYSPVVCSMIGESERATWIKESYNYGTAHFCKLKKHDIVIRPSSNACDLLAGDVFYFIIVDTKEKVSKAKEILHALVNVKINIQKDDYVEDLWWLEVFSGAAGKDQALLYLKSHLACKKVISFGDNNNDIAMFTVSDECFAVENAKPELKSLATAVIPSNDEDGVAIWLSNKFKCRKV